jgi:hypothetical protein
MLKNLTYRQKLKYLGMGAILLIIICYQFSFSKTIKEYKTYKLYNSISSNTLNDEAELNLLQSKNRMLDGILDKFLLDTLDQAKSLLAVAGNFCNANNLQLKEYKPFPAVQTDSIKTVIRSITVQGGFVNCLRLLYHLETRADVGRISSVNFKSFSAPGNSAMLLNCTVFIQNLIPSKNETN